MKSTKDINNDTFKEIVKYKIEFVEKEANNIFGEENRRKIVQTQLASVAGTYAQKEEVIRLPCVIGVLILCLDEFEYVERFLRVQARKCRL